MPLFEFAIVSPRLVAFLATGERLIAPLPKQRDPSATMIKCKSLQVPILFRAEVYSKTIEFIAFFFETFYYLRQTRIIALVW